MMNILHLDPRLLGVLGAAVLALAAGTARGEAVLPPACTIACVSPYGQVLGRSHSGVEAYSNCNADCVVPVPHRLEGTYTGIKWQCVEYARRWLLVNHGAVYGDVDVAADIWHKIDHLTRVADGQPLALDAHLNGVQAPPQHGDLLIYGREFLGTGHVAVVTDVDAAGGVLRVAEQNYANAPWVGKTARAIELVRHHDRWWVLDPHLIGWKRIAAAPAPAAVHSTGDPQ